MKTAARWMTLSIGECHAGQLVGVDDEANDFAVDDSDSTRWRAAPVRSPTP